MENAIHQIRLNPDGTLVRCTSTGEQPFDFNAVYRGFYPQCRFTAAAHCRSGFYLAGMDDRGCAHLFSSAAGSVWTETVITPLTHPELPGVCGEIRTILESPSYSHIYLICQNGYVITLPGCPKCVKETSYPETFSGGRIEGEDMLIDCESGNQVTVLLAALQQLRTSWSFAAPAIQAGAMLIDLRDEADCQQALPYAVHETVQDALRLVRKMPQEAPLYLFCYTGAQADTVAQYARFLGHMNTFSLGGPEDLLSHNNGQWPIFAEK